MSAIASQNQATFFKFNKFALFIIIIINYSTQQSNKFIIVFALLGSELLGMLLS
jgi:hypothetical protein